MLNKNNIKNQEKKNYFEQKNKKCTKDIVSQTLYFCHKIPGNIHINTVHEQKRFCKNTFSLVALMLCYKIFYVQANYGEIRTTKLIQKKR